MITWSLSKKKSNRPSKNKEQLTPERIQRLDDLRFVWDAHTEQWEQRFSELANYKDENNDCLVPNSHKTPSGFRLGWWVGTQRGNKDQLTPERIQRLDHLGFAWDVDAERWERGFSELTKFKDAKNHCRVRQHHKTASGFKLGFWVDRQRRAYKKDQLTSERIQRLDDLGFVWRVN